jgi:hypothetical protein
MRGRDGRSAIAVIGQAALVLLALALGGAGDPRVPPAAGPVLVTIADITALGLAETVATAKRRLGRR